jgi:hypothetical protein
MARRFFLVLSIAWTLGGCLPNPQSEWTSSAGGSQRSTLEDPTILAGSTVPPGGGGIFDFDWGSAFSFWGSRDDHGGPGTRDRAHPIVEHRVATLGAGHVTSSRSSGGGGGGGGGRRR